MQHEMMHHELFLRDNGKRKMRQSLILLQSLEKIDTLMKNKLNFFRVTGKYSHQDQENIYNMFFHVFCFLINGSVRCLVWAIPCRTLSCHSLEIILNVCSRRILVLLA